MNHLALTKSSAPRPETGSAGPSAMLPDWLPPLVWLDMVRSLRMPGFIIGFLILQVFNAAAILAMTNLGFGQVPMEERKLWDGWFWIALAVPFLIIFPISAYCQLRVDANGKLLEPMHLTKMRGINVLFGEWMSHNLRIALMACTLLPCLTLRYYAFGSNPMMDLLYLTELLFVSSTLCACALAVAAPPTVLERVGVLAAAVVCWWPYFCVWSLYQYVINAEHYDFRVFAAFSDTAQKGFAFGNVIYVILGSTIALYVGAWRFRPYGSVSRKRRAEGSPAHAQSQLSA